MKEIIKKHLKNEIERYNKILLSNSLTDEDRMSIEDAIKSLTDTMEAVDTAEDESVVEELRTTIQQLQEQLTAIKEKITQEQENIEKEGEIKMENYIDTRKAYNEYAKMMRTSNSVASFNKAWQEHVKLQNNITISEGSEIAYMPTMVKGKIQDAWDRDAGWLKRLKITNFKNYVVRYNPGSKWDETSRAAGWRPGCTKEEQQLELVAKSILPQMIYKIQSIDADMAFGDEDGSVLDYILDELTRQIIWEIKCAILVGDGREQGCNKIDGIEQLMDENNLPTENTPFITYVTTNNTLSNNVWSGDADGSFLIDELHNLVTKVKKYAGEEVTLFVSEALISNLSRVAASDTATPMYIDDEQLARMLRVDHIEVTDILTGDPTYAIAMVDRGYVLNLPNGFNPTLTRQIDIYKNTEIFREELRAQGLIEGLQSVAVLYYKYNEE